MVVTERLRLPVSGAGCGSIKIIANSVELFLEYEYISEDDENDYVGGIKFIRTDSFRFRKEMLSAGFVQGSYDAIVEIKGSKWHEWLIEIEPNNIGSSTKNKKHFAVFLTNNGYLEVIAEGFEEMRSRKGDLN